jgi:DNA-binding NtrC family response regulator
LNCPEKNHDIRHQQSILVVDDDQHVLEVLDARLSSGGFRVFKAPGAHEALKIIKAQHVDLMISDMKMPGMGGMGLLTEVRSLRPGLPLIFLTAYGTIPDAVRAVKAGAVDYLAKPFNGRELLTKIRKILEGVSLHLAGDEVFSGSQDFENVESPAMKELYDVIERVAASDVNVLILGESGVGKEHAAHIIHKTGPRRDQPLVVVDCSSTPAGLLESELFGHVKGSFTHAIRDKKGLIETADGGTLFLDEIGNIKPEMQTRLLRFLEDRKIRRIGAVRGTTVDCRIIAATNTDLLRDIKEGLFREDLYYRLRVVTLKIPLLRERKEDIPLLSQYFVETFCKSQSVPMVKIPSETMKWLCDYPWPGNVRELKNALQAAVVLCKDGVLRTSDLHHTGLPEIPGIASAESDPFSLEESERNTIIRALKQAGGVQKDAAKLLGISRRAIHYKTKKYEIDSSALRPTNNKSH